MSMLSVKGELEKKLKDLDFEMKELRDTEDDDIELYKIMERRMDELKNKSTSLPPQLRIIMEGMKRREAMNIIDEKIGLLQWTLRLLKDKTD